MGDTLYLDTEFNGADWRSGRELISLALAAPEGKNWYGVWPEPRVWNAWCYEHVFPVLNKEPEAPDLLRASLREYLKSRAPCTIYADWPEDFAHLMRLMSGPAYASSFVVPCTMVLLAESEPKPAIPHNALSDAIALMEWHRQTTGARHG